MFLLGRSILSEKSALLSLLSSRTTGFNVKFLTSSLIWLYLTYITKKIKMTMIQKIKDAISVMPKTRIELN